MLSLLLIVQFGCTASNTVSSYYEVDVVDPLITIFECDATTANQSCPVPDIAPNVTITPQRKLNTRKDL